MNSCAAKYWVDNSLLNITEYYTEVIKKKTEDRGCQWSGMACFFQDHGEGSVVTAGGTIGFFKS